MSNTTNGSKVNWVQLLGILVTMIIALGGFELRREARLSAMEIEILQLKNQATENKNLIRELQLEVVRLGK